MVQFRAFYAIFGIVLASVVLSGCKGRTLVSSTEYINHEYFKTQDRVADQSCMRGLKEDCLSNSYRYNVGGRTDEEKFENLVIKYRDICEAGPKKAGYAHGCAKLGLMYEYGNGVEKDYQKAIELYQVACDGKRPEGCYNLGMMYEHGKGVEYNHEKAAAIFDPLCDNGFTTSCSDFVGLSFLSGFGIERDNEKAFVYLSRSCVPDNKKGCSILGTMYFNGLAVPEDVNRAEELYAEGCNADLPLACGILGQLYFSGDDVAQDYQKAAALFEKSCESGDRTSCSYLMVMYADGKGLSQDYKKAFQLAKKECYAAAKPINCEYLAGFYEKGLGVEKDLDEAKRHYRNSRNNYDRYCEANYADACLKLEKIYSKGIGITKDEHKAEEYLNRALGIYDGICAGEKLSDRQVRECAEYAESRDLFLMKNQKLMI